MHSTNLRPPVTSPKRWKMEKMLALTVFGGRPVSVTVVVKEEMAGQAAVNEYGSPSANILSSSTSGIDDDDTERLPKKEDWRMDINGLDFEGLWRVDDGGIDIASWEESRASGGTSVRKSFRSLKSSRRYSQARDDSTGKVGLVTLPETCRAIGSDASQTKKRHRGCLMKF